MTRIDLKETAEKLYVHRPDDSYTVSEIVSLWKMLGVEARRYEHGEVVFKAGFPPTEMAQVISGVLQMRTSDADGNDLNLGAVRVTEYIGITQLFVPEKAYPFDVIAFQTAEVVMLPIKQYAEWRKDPRSIPFFTHIGMNLCRQIQREQMHASVLGGVTIADRLLRYLSFRQQIDGTSSINIPGTMGDLAAYLCVNKCALSRVMGQLREEGRIKYRRNVITLLK